MIAGGQRRGLARASSSAGRRRFPLLWPLMAAAAASQASSAGGTLMVPVIWGGVGGHECWVLCKQGKKGKMGKT